MPQAAPQPIVPLPKHPHFPLPGVMRPPSPRNVPLTRSSGLHPDDTGPKAKLRFPSIGMKIPPPMRVAVTPKQSAPAPIQPVSVPKSQAPVTPVVILPGQGVKDKGFPADPDLEPENEPGSSSNDPPAVPGLPVTEGEFPIIHETPAPPNQAPIPETGSDSDSDATVDYRDQQSGLLALVLRFLILFLWMVISLPLGLLDRTKSRLARRRQKCSGDMLRKFAWLSSTSLRATWITVPCGWPIGASCLGTSISLLVVGS